MIRLLRSTPPNAWLLLCCVALFIGIIEFLRVDGVEAEVIIYAVQPAGALLLAGLTAITLRQHHDRARRHAEKAAIIALVITLWFVLYFAAGLLVGYVNNVLAADLRGIILNLYVFMVPALALEYIRYKLMVVASRRNAKSWGIIVTGIFALYYIHLVRLFTIPDAEAFVHMLFAEAIPALAMSGLLSYLALSAGLAAMFVFRIGAVIVTVVPPVIPKFDWYSVGLSLVLLSLLVYLAIDHYIQARHRNEKRSRRHLNVWQNAIFIGIFIGLMMFMSGFFRYKPVAIMSNSMKPIYARGAMVVVERVDDHLDITIGDILQYEAKGVSITHRVIDIIDTKSGGGRMFITQGDNSPSPDEPVLPEQVTGVVRASAPIIGYPSVMLNELSR